jgi:copper chaperone
MTTLTLHINGMTCGHCVAAVTRALTAVKGVTVEAVAMGTATVHFDPTATTPSDIANAVQDEGYAVASTS